ncbi:DUF3995 domain-containing protein [Tenacibaculum sp. MAR_2009_124]|uniref:DUF3995 domain-containing protein n=1 Tax=Tenacibaculum sp. MAR_2009_124 TaxID=1250059 RepID=UPI0015A26FFE|nr:DUF3995 domain-containing protein [Tenacibaculum sp. MAR_2009_124]
MKKEIGRRKYKSNSLSKILSIVFLFLSAIHFYWAFGGTWGFNNTLPETSEGIKVLSPTFTDSIIVAFVLLLFSKVYLFYQKPLKSKTLTYLKTILLWLIPFLFLLRSIGDLYYVGFFRQIQNTNFAYFDGYLYSPLCLTISFIGFIILIKVKKA